MHCHLSGLSHKFPSHMHMHTYSWQRDVVDWHEPLALVGPLFSTQDLAYRLIGVLVASIGPLASIRGRCHAWCKWSMCVLSKRNADNIRSQAASYSRQFCAGRQLTYQIHTTSRLRERFSIFSTKLWVGMRAAPQMPLKNFSKPIQVLKLPNYAPWTTKPWADHCLMENLRLKPWQLPTFTGNVAIRKGDRQNSVLTPQ